jgi:Uma2 family endonuclease
MNIAVTYPAPGLPPRRAFNVDDIRRMIEAGVLHESERIELVEGEIVVTAAKSIGHDLIQNALNLSLSRAVSEGLYVGNGSTLQLSENVLVEPDIAVISRAVYKADPAGFARPTGDDVLLVIEISVSSLTYDRTTKARLYARHGIREYWVIDANERRAFIHTGPTGDDWSSIVEHRPEDVLTTPALPGFAFKLSDISP